MSFLSRSWVEVPFPCPYAILIELTHILFVRPVDKNRLRFLGQFFPNQQQIFTFADFAGDFLTGGYVVGGANVKHFLV